MITKEEFDGICKKYDLVGANLYYINKEEEVQYCYGYMNKEEQIPTNKDTIYRIASISKSVLAIGIMYLKERNMLDLDEDISHYLGFLIRNPKYPEEKITLRMLLTQTSSITDGFDDEDMTNVVRVDGYNGVNGRYLNVPLKEMLTPSNSKYYSELTFSNYKPGTNFIYSNFGCGIVACIIEKIVKQNYDHFMQKILFNRFSLDASYYAYNIKDQNNIACLYSQYGVIKTLDWAKRAYKHADLGESYLGVAGGLFISMPSLSKIMRSFFDPAYFVLKEETINEMMQVNWEGQADEYRQKGLQLMIMDNVAPIKLYGHFGSAYGLRSFMFFNKELQTGACFVLNGGNIHYTSKNIPDVHQELLEKIWS